MSGPHPTRRWLARAVLGGAALQATGWLEAVLGQGARAEGPGTLRIGLAALNTTLDPHFQSSAPNNAVASHIFDALVTNDARSASRPGLAESWRLLDDTRWEFHLRRTAFTDGREFSAEDAIVSLQRANDLPSTAPLRIYTRGIRNMVATGPRRLLIETREPDPLLLNALSRIRIISAGHRDAPTTEFNNGNAAIGTGALVLEEYEPGSHLRLSRNDGWWGGRLPWEAVELRLIADADARLAALLSGELDIIEAVPPGGAARVKAGSGFHLVRGISSRFVYLAMDQKRDVSPFITDHDGQPLARNPLKDRRVRQALSMAIDRKALVEQVMEGDAVIASQFLPPGGAGIAEGLSPVPFDPARAQALLAEAGYPEGFRLTLHGPGDRYVNATGLMQAVARMLTRVGIQAQAETMPWATYSQRNAGAGFSMSLAAWSVNTGETSSPLRALLATHDRKAGMGASNAGRYSNPELDALLRQALRNMEDGARNTLLARACEIAFTDHALLPLHHEVSAWAARRGAAYEARADQHTLAMGASRTG
ncbi:ABC transporter substrate-binding protein [Roseomonas marmotae]|uniref:ABC transporter substrate-binding protein n=1 Tax=Roseomonas marmotae TaxID=2768161 RepID=A0ABS3KDW5_9PROT|nr:ABC transporter substrate-binding protein [Roseomonas marmotae]MBO1075674.1 ABC transporter substrate-binding protein [Roseomonas marmotae]QTI79532.1 ABC transporter substrate-binding protein [Roseomonas marmotae]